MLDNWSVGMGAKSSGDCQVASAPLKYWRGQKMRNCCFVISMVKDDLVTQEFLELPEKAGCESGLVFQMVCMEPPLVLEEGFQMLCKRGWKALNAQPFCEGRLECKEVPGLAGIKGAVHVGCQEYAEVWW